MSVLYNVLLGLIDAAVGAALWRRPQGRTFLAALAGAGAAAVLLAVGLGEDGFGVMRLACYGLFVHAVALLAASAVLLRRTATRTAVACGLGAVLGAGVGIDAFWVEPTWLEVTRRQIVSEHVARPVRIVVLADLQTDRFGPYERRVLDRVMEEKPDLVLLAGDYVQADGRAQGAEVKRQINAYLRGIGFGAPLGALAVRGNVDGDLDGLFDGLPVKLVSSTQSFEAGGLDLTCLAFEDSLSTAIPVSRPRAERFHVVLGHVPNFALGRIDADLLVAGHTHGGQVRLPLLGPVLTLSAVPRRRAAGLSDLPSGAKLLVSRGVGMERRYAPRLRFLCRPELVVLELVPEPRAE